MNGLLQREDWNKAIKVPLGIIPAGLISHLNFYNLFFFCIFTCQMVPEPLFLYKIRHSRKKNDLCILGSGNGMAKSLLDSSGEPCLISNAVFSIIKGNTIFNYFFMFYSCEKHLCIVLSFHNCSRARFMIM